MRRDPITAVLRDRHLQYLAALAGFDEFAAAIWTVEILYADVPRLPVMPAGETVSVNDGQIGPAADLEDLVAPEGSGKDATLAGMMEIPIVR